MEMGFNLQLADRIRVLLDSYPLEGASKITEKKMFGGLSFLLGGKMAIGVVKEELAVRVIPEKMEDTLKMDFVRPMDFTNRPLKEFVFVAPEGCNTQAKLVHFLNLGLEHAQQKLNNN